MPENKKITNQNEFEINTPHKENEEITTNGHKKNQSNEHVQKEQQPNKWQQDKINEANNEDGNPVDGKGKVNQIAKKGVDKEANVSDKDKGKGEFGDTRKDSIIDRPKTETYEKTLNEDTSKAINEGNYQHAREEEKRQRENKKQNIPQ